MKKRYKLLKSKIFILYSKLNAFILTIMVLGILELGVYYELLLSMMAVFAPEIAPILIVAFVWILFKGIRKMYQESKKKKCIIF